MIRNLEALQSCILGHPPTDIVCMIRHVDDKRAVPDEFNHMNKCINDCRLAPFQLLSPVVSQKYAAASVVLVN